VSVAEIVTGISEGLRLRVWRERGAKAREMARTKSSARKSSARRFRFEAQDVPENVELVDMDGDVFGAEVAPPTDAATRRSPEPDSEDEMDFQWKKENEEKALTVTFDFRKGRSRWPEKVKLVHEQEALKLIEKEEAEAKNSNGEQATDLDDLCPLAPEAPKSTSASEKDKAERDASEDMMDERALYDPSFNMAPEDAKFKTFEDHSTALIIPRGTRLKLDLDSLTSFGHSKEEKRLARKEKRRLKLLREQGEKRMEELRHESKWNRVEALEQSETDASATKGADGASVKQKHKQKRPQSKVHFGGAVTQSSLLGYPSNAATDAGFFNWGHPGFDENPFSYNFRDIIPSYTISMDIRIEDEIPQAGISLFQTELVHAEENERTKKVKTMQSEGECMINKSGGVGILGTFGDVAKAKVETKKWTRIVICVTAASGGESGTMETFIDAQPCATVAHTHITADGRFGLNPSALYLFSSKNARMMPGNILVRRIHVENRAKSKEEVLDNFNSDRFLSMFSEQRKEEADDVRRGLSLSLLFPKPNPIWATPAFVAVFGDAFVEGTRFESSSLISWCFKVVNHVLERSLYEMDTVLELLGDNKRARLADVVFVFNKSNEMMTQMAKLLRYPSPQQLIAFLRELQGTLEDLAVGETIILPACIGNCEIAIVVARQDEQFYRFTIVNTDIGGGLAYHAVSAVESPPNLMYRTCMVLDNVSKKNALDNVFWMAVYHLTFSGNPRDINRFYNILLPFLTGKPLETSLVEAEMQSKHNLKSGAFGDWRKPQSSNTAFVRCILEALHHCLRETGLSVTDSDIVSLALRAEFVKLLSNDMDYYHPSTSGAKMCDLACEQLAHSAMHVMQELRREDRVSEARCNDMLKASKALIDQVQEKILGSEGQSSKWPYKLRLGTRSMETPRSLGRNQLEEETTATATKQGGAFELKADADAPATATINDPVDIKVKHMILTQSPLPITVTVSKSGLTRQLFQKLAEKLHVPLQHMKILFMGKLLAGDKPLAEYKLDRNGKVVHLTISEPKNGEKSPYAASRDNSSTEEDESARQVTQFCDLLMWDVQRDKPYSGEAKESSSYVPIDFLQIPERVHSRIEAVDVIRQIDRLCTLLDNQEHSIKNDKLLVLNLIQHAFTHVVPLPAPKAPSANDIDTFKSERAFRRKARSKTMHEWRTKRRKRDNDESQSESDDEPNEDDNASVKKAATDVGTSYSAMAHRVFEILEKELSTSSLRLLDNLIESFKFNGDVTEATLSAWGIVDETEIELIMRTFEDAQAEQFDAKSMCLGLRSEVTKRLQLSSSFEATKKEVEHNDSDGDTDDTDSDGYDATEWTKASPENVARLSDLIDSLDKECKVQLLSERSQLDDTSHNSCDITDYVDSFLFFPGLGQKVRIKYNGEVAVWYLGTVARINPDETYFIVYQDGDTDESVPRENLRSTYAPRVQRTVAQKNAATRLYYNKLKRCAMDWKEEMQKALAEQTEQKSEEKASSTLGNTIRLKPDLAAGVRAEGLATSRPCLWTSEPIEYALQVELLLALQRIMEHFAYAVFSQEQCRPLDAVSLIVPGCIAAISDAVMRQIACDTPSEATSNLEGRTCSGRQLGFPGFGLGVATFAEQTETIEIHQPELCTARTAILDYFESPAQRRYLKIFTWENAHYLKPNYPLKQYLANISKEVALGDAKAAMSLLRDAMPHVSQLLHNYPELRCYRDIAFYWKYFMNPDITAFPNYRGKDGGMPWSPGESRLDAQLSWGWCSDRESYTVTAFNDMSLFCKPKFEVDALGNVFDADEGPPTHRFPSTATPSHFLDDPPVYNEDDIVYRAVLPGFEHDPEDIASNDLNDSDLGSDESEMLTHTTQIMPNMPVLGQHDSELLLSYLTVPYMRIPLVITFFSSDDRLHKLQSKQLQTIVDSIMFEPGRFLSLQLHGVEPVMVPTPYPELLASPSGMLLNELASSPDSILSAIIRLLHDALALDTGSVTDVGANDFNASVRIILFVVRLACRVENYLSFMVRRARATPEEMAYINSDRDMPKPTTEQLAKLENVISQIRLVLFGEVSDLFQNYLRKLDAETTTNPDQQQIVNRNSRLACDLHAHKLLICRNVALQDLNMSKSKMLIGSFLYLTTRHTWNRPQRDMGKLLIPEFQLYEVIHVQRRNLIQWCNSLSQLKLDRLMHHVMKLSTYSSGSVGVQDDQTSHAQKWSRVAGLRCMGRFVVTSMRSGAKEQTPVTKAHSSEFEAEDKDNLSAFGSASDTGEIQSIEGGDVGTENDEASVRKLLHFAHGDTESDKVEEVAANQAFGMEVDIQLGQMTLKSGHLSALDSKVSHPDITLLFGSATLQASVLQRATRCSKYRLAGLQHDIEHWKETHKVYPPIRHNWDRRYDPAGLFPSENWLPILFEPVRRQFFDGTNPMEFIMSSLALREEADLAVLIGIHPVLRGAFKLVYVFRHLRCVHVYECLSHGKQWWWSLHLTTDSRYCMRSLQPSTSSRTTPYPKWWERGAGVPFPAGIQSFVSTDVAPSDDGSSVLIVREASHPENLSGGRETFVPERLLYGALPCCLFEKYRFWHDETWESACLVPSDGGTKKSRFHVPISKITRVIRGYPLNESEDSMLLIHIQPVDGGRSHQMRGSPTGPGIDALGGEPGTVIRVTKVSKSAYRSKYLKKECMALVLSTLKLLDNNEEDYFKFWKERVPRQISIGRQEMLKEKASEKKGATRGKAKKKRAKRTEAQPETQALIEPIYDTSFSGRKVPFKPGEEVHYEEKESQQFDVVVLRQNKDGTYDIRGIRGAVAGQVFHRVDGKELCDKSSDSWSRRNDFWGATDDYDTDDSEASAKSNESKKSKENDTTAAKHRSVLSFQEFTLVDLVLEVADWDVESCQSMLHNIRSFGTSTFPDMQTLADALHAVSVSGQGGTPLLGLSDTTTSGPPKSYVLEQEQHLSETKSKASNTRSSSSESSMVMLNLLYARKGSRLFSLVKTLTRIENLSHIIAWVSREKMIAWEEDHFLKHGSAANAQFVLRGCPPVDLVELPRLKLSFTVRETIDGELRLYSLDHSDLFVSNSHSPSTTNMLRGIPHSLLMSNSQGELQVLVPLVVPTRPAVINVPFTVELVLNREDSDWDSQISQRYFLYPVHVSSSFLMTRGLESALYLMLLRFLHRDYEEVSRLADSVASDTKFGTTAQSIFDKLSLANDDWHPDAHACRLKISLVTLNASAEQPWDLTTQCARYIVKLPHVSASCRLAESMELQLLETDSIIVTNEKHPLFSKDIHTEFNMVLVKNRFHALQTFLGDQGEQETQDLQIKCWIPTRIPTSNWPYQMDKSLFGETYHEALSVTKMSDWAAIRAKGQEAGFNQRLENTEHELPMIARPEGGWLTLACFHVHWVANCESALLAMNELAPTCTSCTFVNVQADSLDMGNAARDLAIKSFPTIILFRGGKEVEGGRITTDNGLMEAIAALLKTNLQPDDETCYQALCEAEESLNQKADSCNQNQSSKNSEETEEGDGYDEDDGELQWSWDVEECGPSFAVSELGMHAVMRKMIWPGDIVRWEYKLSRENKWVPINPELNELVEARYHTGELYSHNELLVKSKKNGDAVKFHKPSSLKLESDLLSGLSGTICLSQTNKSTIEKSAEFRRFGPRRKVSGEPHRDPRQQEKDRIIFRQQETEAYHKALYLKQQKGKNHEAIRSSAGFVPNSGVHEWTLRWGHEPARQGLGDSVGLCSEHAEDFGPSAPPCLGSERETSSLALFASGKVFFKGECIALGQVRYQTDLTSTSDVAEEVIHDASTSDVVNEKPVAEAEDKEPGSTGEDLEKEQEEDEEAEGAGKENCNSTLLAGRNYDLEELGLSTTDHLDVIPLLSMAENSVGDIAMGISAKSSTIWGRQSLVTCTLDTDTDGGVLTFTVDGIPLDGVRLTNVFRMLGGSVLYPCISLSPFEPAEVFTPPASNDRTNAKKTDVTSVARDDDLKEAGNVDADEKEEFDEFLSHALVELSAQPNSELWKKLHEGTKDTLKRIGELAPLFKCLQPSEPSVLLVAEDNLVDAQDNNSGEHNGRAPTKSLGDESGIKDTKTINSSTSAEEDDSEESSESDAQSSTESESEADENSTGSVVDPKDQASSRNDTTSKAKQDSDTIAIERCIWMFQIRNAWYRFTTDICASLETSRRNGEKECDVPFGQERILIHFTKPNKQDPTIVASFKNSLVRRVIESKGIQKGWETLSLSYRPPFAIREESAVEILKKVWHRTEKMNGSKCGFGFLLLYDLLQGSIECKIVEPYSSWQSYWQPTSTRSDSFRFGSLLYQLYQDKGTPSMPSSIISILSKNKQLCSRMPKFEKSHSCEVYNGWANPGAKSKNALADLMSTVVPTLRALKRKRGAMQFPPKPPFPELEAHPSAYHSDVNSLSAMNSRIVRPELGDTSCSSRALQPVHSEEILRLAQDLRIRLVASPLRLGLHPLECIEDDFHFHRVTKPLFERNELIVLEFHADWCMHCPMVTKTVLNLSRRTPGVHFFQVSFDECDLLCKALDVHRLPQIKLYRGGIKKQHCVTALEGLEEVTMLKESIRDVASASELEAIDAFEKEAEQNKTFNVSQDKDNISVANSMAISHESLCQLARAPLGDLSEEFNSSHLNEDEGTIAQTLPFDVRNHDAAASIVAKSMITRMENDIAAWQKSCHLKKSLELKGFTRHQINTFCHGEANLSSEVATAGLTCVDELLSKLGDMRNCDASAVGHIVPFLIKCANWVEPKDEFPSSAFVQSSMASSPLAFSLRRLCGQEVYIWIEFLFGALLSSTAFNDIARLNPSLSKDTIATLLKLVAVTMLRANRIGHVNRAIGLCTKLKAKLKSARGFSVAQRKAQADSLELSLTQMCQGLCDTLADGRHFIDSSTLKYDPRYLLFEFTWNLLLREKQVQIVHMFVENLAKGHSKVKQMIMGAGKTTVVAPLLALLLGDGQHLVMSVVPKALLEMSRTRMRESFSAMVKKRIYTLQFDRNTQVTRELRRNLETAVTSRGIVVATPTAIKSVLLSYIEVLTKIEDANRLGIPLDEASLAASGIHKQAARANESALSEIPGKQEHLSLERQVVELEKVLQLFRSGSMLLDEVDLVLHPLKSELNFPMGEKYDLDASQNGERWSLPIHLLDAILYSDSGRMSVFEQSGQASEILQRISSLIQVGYNQRALQKLPHITLLNPDFYSVNLLPALAEWVYLWLQKHHLHGISRSETIQYLIAGGEPRSAPRLRVNGLEGADRTECAAFFTSNRIHEITEVLYKQEDSLTESLKHRAEFSAQIQHRISTISAQLEKAQRPRDTSMDNSVVLWFNEQFLLGNRNNTSGEKRAAMKDEIGSQCALLEEAGFTIRRCGDRQEVTNLARGLASNHRLRCVIIGDSSSSRTCSSTCEDDHEDSTCVVCKKPWGRHSSHTCMNGGRGSFPVLTQDDSDLAQIARNLLQESETSNSLPAARLVVYDRFSIEEADRIDLWHSGVTVVESGKELQKFLESDALKTTISETPKEDLTIPPTPSNPAEEHESYDISSDDPDIVFLKEKLGRGPDGQLLSCKETAQGANPLKQQQGTFTDQVAYLQAKLAAFEVTLQETTELDEEFRTARRQEMSLTWDSLQAVLDEESALIRASMRLIPQSLVPQERRAEIEKDTSFKIHPMMLGVKVDSSLIAVQKMKKESCSVQDAEEVFRTLSYNLQWMDRLLLGGKVVSRVSLPQKKLLNLCRDWLRTFLPHCLAKVNRVSFGLLSDADCKRALKEDPRTPLSRLKLAVPFVGKDVPSSSSEFAHPDITIGLTILGYRYSGLRKSDFMSVVDDITVDFAHEIGPSSERKSSLRFTEWVTAAGGTIRGGPVKPQKAGNELDRSAPGTPVSAVNEAEQIETEKREVVQLKYLQKSNVEQMLKLYDLWKLEPLAIYHYLSHSILPTHMRSQRTKISASGQAIGGDMLVEKKIGFSGTPSDLLPVEMGRCDYETGDDGKMLGTVLDPNITSFSFVASNWSMENLLRDIATASDPPFHALIDTGALITGLSNLQVAKALLKYGLPWCQGVVYLDDDDRQQVLVRATGRVISADQCGVPLESRFAFYDQIHTTGMDIQHVVNAKAVITLGKDMTFRDYVQGAFRMRGIGKGQTICAYIIPEVQELMKRELRSAGVPNGTYCKTPEDSKTLVDIAGWLVINSMRSEQVQWSMLCMQNVANVYRKNALKELTRSSEPSDPSPQALQVFREHIDFSLEDSVPDPKPFSERLVAMIEANKNYVWTEAESRIGESILADVVQYTTSSLNETSAQKLESEQEREQEQEQEREVQQTKEQEIEIEKFVEREYSRTGETPRPWPIQLLASEPDKAAKEADDGVDYPFFPLSQFSMHHQEPIAFPSFMYYSRNYFNPQWHGLRRVKNVVMVLEWTPNLSKVHGLSSAENQAFHPIDETAKKALDKAYELLSARTGQLTPEDLAVAVEAAIDIKMTPVELSDVVAEYGTDRDMIDRDGLERLLVGGRLRKIESGRYYLVLSLSEAETIRRVIHLKGVAMKNLIQDKSTEAALHFTPVTALTAKGSHEGQSTEMEWEPTQSAIMQSVRSETGVTLDASTAWRRSSGRPFDTGAPHFQALVAYTCARFLDCSMHFRAIDLNVLLCALQKNSTTAREQFFLHVIGCKRRLEQKWQESPLAKVFRITSEWMAFKQRAQAVFVREAIRSKKLTIWEAFTAFDADDNGSLSPAEWYGALRWLAVPNLSPDDVLDTFDVADSDCDGNISYKEYVEFLQGEDEVEDESIEDPANASNAHVAHPSSLDTSTPHGCPSVEPYGAEQLRLLIAERARAASKRREEEKAQREAYAKAHDIKIFEEELLASKARTNGANPALYSTCDDSVQVSHYSFTRNEKPLRMHTSGKVKFAAELALCLEEFPSIPLDNLYCLSGHLLAPTRYTYNICDSCGGRQVESNCECCDFDLCKRCCQRARNEKEKYMSDLDKQNTALKCQAGASFSLQIPASILEKSSSDARGFSVSMEIWVQKLPFKDGKIALLSFARSDSLHLKQRQSSDSDKVTIFIDKNGHVTDGSTFLEGEQGSIKVKWWHTVTVCVEPATGTLTTHVGEFSYKFQSPQYLNLELTHQLDVFGGTVHRDLRGGLIRHLRIYDKCLVPTEVKSEVSSNSSLPMVLVLLPKDERAAKLRKTMNALCLGYQFNVQMCETEDEILSILEQQGAQNRSVHGVIAHIWKQSYEDENGKIVSPGFEEGSAMEPPGITLARSIRKVSMDVPIFLEVKDAPRLLKTYIVGEWIKARTKSEKKFKQGKVKAVHQQDDGTFLYDLEFKDHDDELRVNPKHIKPDRKVGRPPRLLSKHKCLTMAKELLVQPFSDTVLLQEKVLKCVTCQPSESRLQYDIDECFHENGFKTAQYGSSDSSYYSSDY